MTGVVVEVGSRSRMVLQAPLSLESRRQVSDNTSYNRIDGDGHRTLCTHVVFPQVGYWPARELVSEGFLR